MQYSKLKNCKNFCMTGLSLTIALVTLLSSIVAYASLVVIGSKDIRISHLNNTQLSSLYLGKSVSLPTGETLNPIDQDPDSKIYADFYNNVIGMDPSSVGSYWSGLVFSGTGTRPPQVEGDRSAIAAVENTNKAIAYVDSTSLGPQLANVKVLYGSVSPNDRRADQQQPAPKQSVNPVFQKHQASNQQLRQKLAQEIAALQIQQQRYKQLNAQRQQQLLQILKTEKTIQKKHPKATAIISAAPQQAMSSAPATNLWLAMRNHFSLNRQGHEAAIRRELRWYVAHRWIVTMILKNSEPYIGYVYQQTQKRQMPAEFALLPMVESGYVPFARSSAGAAGLWQILPNTAMGNALKINWWYDGRLDIINSTKAALDYLSRLHAGLHSWALAAAAYNAGEGAILAAIDLNKRKGLPTNYWALPLAKQTRDYLPKLLALSAIISNPSKYRFKLPALTTQPNFATIHLTAQIDRAQIANLADISEEVVHELNPGMLRWATAPHSSYTIAIPADKLSTFKINLARLANRKRLLWVYHKVVNGQTLPSLAKRYHTTVAELKKVNNLHSTKLKNGQGIIVPILSNKTYADFAPAVQKTSINDIDQVTANGLLDGDYSKSLDNQKKSMLPKPQSVTQPSSSSKQSNPAKPPTDTDDLKTLMDKLYN